MKLIAVTSCPTGIAHTYMAAEALEQAAKAAGHEIHVETQGSAGIDPAPADAIEAADAVIFAADVEVRERARFDGKPIVTGSVKDGINRAEELVQRAVDAAAAASSSAAATADTKPPHGEQKVRSSADRALSTKTDSNVRWTSQLRGWLMTGVSYMIPFVAAGGLLIALAFLIGGAKIATQVNGGVFEGVEYAGVANPADIFGELGIAGVLFQIGSIAFSMLVPVLAGFIAFAMADRPGLVPGFVAGLLATAVGAGFLGGLAGGLIAGAVALWLVRLQVPSWLQGIMPVVIIPLVSTAVVGIIMLLVIGKPVAEAQTALTDWLNGLSGTSGLALGLLLGAMMAFDMGGPVNKVAYTFGVASLASGNYEIMAAVMAAGMTPPLACALATVLRPKLFAPAEQKAGEAGWLLGASFITEGAIPFAAADPLRVIPALMSGSAVAGAISMQLGATSRAPHGGIWVVGLIGTPLAYVLAILAGTAVSTAALVLLKSRRPALAGSEAEADEPAGSTTSKAPRAVTA